MAAQFRPMQRHFGSSQTALVSIGTREEIVTIEPTRHGVFDRLMVAGQTWFLVRSGAWIIEATLVGQDIATPFEIVKKSDSSVTRGESKQGNLAAAESPLDQRPVKSCEIGISEGAWAAARLPGCLMERRKFVKESKRLFTRGGTPQRERAITAVGAADLVTRVGAKGCQVAAPSLPQAGQIDKGRCYAAE